MLIAEKGTMGVPQECQASITWHCGQEKSVCAFYQHCSNCSGNKWNFSIFLTTVDVTGGIGLDLQNWVKLLTKMEMQFVMKMVM
jgi:aconitate hydratase 2/2-methylisocitrate dehydratase